MLASKSPPHQLINSLSASDQLVLTAEDGLLHMISKVANIPAKFL